MPTNEKTPPEIYSHWYALAENLDVSPHEVYELVTQAVRRRDLPKAKVTRVIWRESGLGSADREYLRVSSGKLCFDICAAPYGNRSSFFSWWLAAPQVKFGVLYSLILSGGLLALFYQFIKHFGFGAGLGSGAVVLVVVCSFLGTMIREGIPPIEEQVLAMPFYGRLYEAVFLPATYYRLDTVHMFQESVRAAVKEVVDELTKGQVLRSHLGTKETQSAEPVSVK